MEAHLQLLHLENLAIMSRFSALVTAPVVHTQLLHRAVSTLQRIIRMIMTLFTVCSTIPSKVVTTVPVRLMFTVLQR